MIYATGRGMALVMQEVDERCVVCELRKGVIHNSSWGQDSAVRFQRVSEVASFLMQIA